MSSSPTPAPSPSPAPRPAHPESRFGEVEEALRRATNRITHPTHSHLVREALESLKHGLYHAHAHEHDVDDAAWADYRTRLDQGLSELEAEIARVDAVTEEGGPPDEATLADVLHAHVSRMELDGWRLRLAVSGIESVDREAVRRHIENAARGIDSLAARNARDACAADNASSGAGYPRAEIDHSLDQLRKRWGSTAARENTPH